MGPSKNAPFAIWLDLCTQIIKKEFLEDALSQLEVYYGK